MIIDAENMILGRVATFAAKKALLGEDINVINCEKAVVTGNKKEVLTKYVTRKERGTHKGPITLRNPDRFFKRAIRGMLPYKRENGKKAFKNIKCHIGVPDEIKDKKAVKVAGADVSKVPNLNYVTVKEICKILGAKL